MFENLIKMFLLFFQIGFNSLQILIKKNKNYAKIISMQTYQNAVGCELFSL